MGRFRTLGVGSAREQPASIDGNAADHERDARHDEHPPAGARSGEDVGGGRSHCELVEHCQPVGGVVQSNVEVQQVQKYGTVPVARQQAQSLRWQVTVVLGHTVVGPHVHVTSISSPSTTLAPGTARQASGNASPNASAVRVRPLA